MARTERAGAKDRAKDLPLRRDVRVLGRMLGQLLREQGSQALYDRVESARRRAIARRADEAGAEAELASGLEGLPPDAALGVARAFSAWFGLVNTAERMQRLRRRASYRTQGAAQPGSARAVMAELARAGATAEELSELLANVVVEPVLTAHPTEALRRTLLSKERRIARALLARGRALTDEQALRIVREELTIAWQTEEHRADRPSVADELEHALFFLSESLWIAAPRARREFERAVESTFGRDVRRAARSVELRFGSWIGGDMDGNPAVGPDTIRASVARQSERAIERYVEELRELFRRLSQSRTRVVFAIEYVARVEAMRERMPEAAAGIPARYAGMLHREHLWLMSARLEATRDGREHAYADASEFLDDLFALAQSLAGMGGRNAGLARVRRLIERVRCFGLHFATLDVRRDSLEHRRAVGELLGARAFEELPADERTSRLLDALEDRSTKWSIAGTDAQRSTDVVRAIAEVRKRYGEDSIGLFVLSMAQGPDDALAVMCIARAAGYERDGAVPIDIAPLFETVDDLERAPATLEALLAAPIYRAHVAARGSRQWVMLGYSDSNKTSGMIASRVALQRAQCELLEVAARRGVELNFFHGRGGSVSRGGSKPRDAILASPPGSIGGRLRVTEQGEIVRAKFGMVGIAERTLDLLLAAVVERTWRDLRDPKRDNDVDPLALELASDARAAYRKLVEDDPEFIDYFRAATPIDVIERLALGSRPSRRREMRGVQDLRAIPWVFAWTQSRHLLPGWFGAGAALQKAIERHGLEALRAAAKGSTFLQTLVADLEMVLAKSDLGIARRYSALSGPSGERIFALMCAEHAAACDAVLAIAGSKRLLDRDPRLQRSIELRNPYVDPMSFLQVDLLARWRESGREDPALERALFATVRGIARGMQNTG